MDYRETSRIANRARTAINTKDWANLRYCGNRFERAGFYREAWKVLAASVEGDAAMDRPIWLGPERPCRSLLVLPRSRDLGDELRVIRFVAHAAHDVEQVTALVEKRLIPLLSRSFPQVQFIDRRTTVDVDDFSHLAAQERLAYWYGHDDDAIATSFLPLIPPPGEGDARGIGIAWYSRALGKTLPSLEDWGAVLTDWKGRLQSLQYRELDAGINQLRSCCGRPIKSARCVDQIKSLDDFAAQIAGLRGVLTISNTTAHMAGALGIPCVVVLDNGIVTTWPYVSRTTPFYPYTRLIRRGEGSWLEALHRGRAELLRMVQAASPTSP
jgi:hypothetical protein